jgi:hypothetical protein
LIEIFRKGVAVSEPVKHIIVVAEISGQTAVTELKTVKLPGFIIYRNQQPEIAKITDFRLKLTLQGASSDVSGVKFTSVVIGVLPDIGKKLSDLHLT